MLALFATSLFAGLGLSRQLISEVGVGRRRFAASVGFALITTFVIGAVFTGVSLADNAALADRAGAHSRFGPTSATLIPPECNGKIVGARTAQVDLDLWGDVDGRSVGTAGLIGSRSGENVSWKAQVARTDLFGEYGVTILGSNAWTLQPDGEWTAAKKSGLESDLLDATVLAQALTPHEPGHSRRPRLRVRRRCSRAPLPGGGGRSLFPGDLPAARPGSRATRT